MSVPDRLSRALEGRYQIEREIGAGGMATVYLARDIRHMRRVALKVLRPDLAAAIGAERFLLEIETTASLQHPHILALHDSGEVDGTVFYVMPYVEGETLRQLIEREKQLPVDVAVRIAIEVANALDYAHRHGVIHRDVKPENILLHDGHAVVADFGIALAASGVGRERLTATGVSLGTPMYMSPEQAMGERAIDARADVYALGCVLYEMLTGEPPFTGPTAQAIVAKVMADEPRAPRQLRKTVPPHVEAALMSALQKLPADRLASAADFAAALENTAAQPARHPAIVSPALEALPRSGTRPAWVPWAFLAIGLGAGAAMVWMMSRPSREAGFTAEPRHFSIALPDSAPLVAGRESFGKALTSFALSRDGARVVYVTAAGNGTHFVLLNLDNGTSRSLAGTANARSPTFSPDGSAIAFVDADSVVRRLSLDDGSVTRIAAGGPDLLTWGDDNRIYFAGGCQVAPAKGGPATALLRTGCSESIASPDAAVIGSRTDWMLVHRRGVIELLSTKTGDVQPISLPSAKDPASPEAQLLGSSPRFVPPGSLVFARGSTLFAARFDVKTLKLLSDPQPVLQNVRREQSGQAHFAVSSDGTLVWAEGGDEAVAQFVWVTDKGIIQDTLFVPPAVVESYALSPDGQRLAYSTVLDDGRTFLMVADLARRVVDRISYPLPLHPFDWIRGGTALSAMLYHHDGTAREVLVNFDSAQPTIDTLTWLGGDESRDGTLRCRHPAFGTVTSSGTDVRLWDTRSLSDTTRLADYGHWCRFSPDGRFVAWTGQIVGEGAGVFVAPATGPARGTRVQVAPAGADEPRWSSDGRRIRYRRATRWFEVPAPTADLRPAGAPRLLFEGYYLQAWASWDAGGDGRLLLLQGVPAMRRTRLDVMTNFPRFLEQKLRSAQ